MSERAKAVWGGCAKLLRIKLTTCWALGPITITNSRYKEWGCEEDR